MDLRAVAQPNLAGDTADLGAAAPWLYSGCGLGIGPWYQSLQLILGLAEP